MDTKEVVGSVSFVSFVFYILNTPNFASGMGAL